MSKVFVLDTHKQPLNPVHPGRARLLLSSGKAAVLKRYPFTIILKTLVEQPVLEPLRVKIDPGSKTTGLALVNDATGEVVFAAELEHRGEQITKALARRRAVRRSRRNRKTRYRQPRYANRRKKKGWLPPSLESRISNLTLACAPCNTKKGTQDIHVFLAGQPDLVARILAQATAPLKDATTVNAIRWRLYEGLLALGLPVECGSGGLTKFNRTRRAFPKTHWLDAACVGKNTPERLCLKGVVPLLIKANGHGCRQLCLMDEHGFPRTKPKQKKFRHLFRTGDIVQARVPAHLKHPGIHVGRVSAKANGAFTIATKSGKVTDIGKKYCRCLQRADGYGYLQKGEAAFLPAPFRGREEMPFFYG
ncbi:MAG: RNA-guided endonuclease IscB [Ktedonobacteraceae bacterium]